MLKKITATEKVSRVILRVFFRQSDACIVTKDALTTMSELNPQLRRQLIVLAESPEVVPSVLFFRPGFEGSLRDTVETAILTLHETVAGRQALTVFQGDKVVKCPMSSLKSAHDLLNVAIRPRSPRPVQQPAAPHLSSVGIEK